MSEEIKNLPVSSTDSVLRRHENELQRHDTDIELQKEQWQDQQEINDQNRIWKIKYEEELKLLRDAYRNDRSMVIVFWQVLRVLGKWSLYIGAAAIGWAWNHWDKLELLFPKPSDKS